MVQGVLGARHRRHACDVHASVLALIGLSHHLYKDFMRNVHLCMLAHFLFTLLLLVEQFVLAAHIAAIQMPGHVLSECFE